MNEASTAVVVDRPLAANEPDQDCSPSLPTKGVAGVPALGVVLLCGACAIAGGAVGFSASRPAPKFAVAEKGSIVLQAFLEHPALTPTEAQRQVSAPILAVLKRYSDRGFLVVNVARDRTGQLMVDAVPPDAVDITPELRRAVGLADASTVLATPVARGAVASAPRNEGGR